MKLIKNIANFGIALSLISLLFVACTDKNDWEIDSQYDRLFSSTKVSASVKEKTDVEFTWTATPGTQFYVIELSQDSLYDEIEMGATATSIILGEDKSITKSPFVISGLEGYTKYFYRIRGLSSEKEGSRWAYPETKSFTTKGEQIFNAVAAEDKTDKSVVLRWSAGNAPVTHIILSNTITATGEVQEKRIELTADDKTKGEILLDDLLEATTYTAAIYNGENKRGEVSFRTNSSLPTTGVTRRLNGTEDLVAYLDTITANEVTLILPAGSIYEPSWVDPTTSQVAKSLPLSDNITSITFWGEEGGVQPVIKTTAIKLGLGVAKLSFKNVEVKGHASASDYLLNESATLPISEITFDECTLNNFRGVVRFQGGTNNSALSRISFVDCVVHTIEGYGLVNNVATTMFSDINIENCTFYNLKEVFVVLKSKPNSLVMRNCTFYNAIKTGKYYFDCKNGDNNVLPTVFRIEKCIFGKAYNLKAGENIRFTNPGKAGEFVSDSYYTNDCVLNNGYPMTGATLYEQSSTDLFVNPDDANFRIKDSAFPGINKVGAPMWWN